MVKPKKDARFFSIDVESEESLKRLKALDAIKRKGPIAIKEVSEDAGMDISELSGKLEEKELVEKTGTGGEALLKLKEGERCSLGVGFSREECILTLVDSAGNVKKKEEFEIGVLKGFKGRIRELKEIIKDISKGTRLRGSLLHTGGIAIPDYIMEKNEKAADILSEGVSHLFGCEVIVSKEATAAAYGERDSNEKTKGKDILYLYTDIGQGVVIKEEEISENREKGDEAYLKPWGQFDVVKTATSLVDKGLGTDIVTMVNGDLSSVELSTVLDAAENKDELAEDLVKRSALALGVRGAYLANIFDVDLIVLGGGTEKKEGKFVEYVRESAEKFLLKDKLEKIKIIPGVLQNEASSIGAALLCRRELFMEV